MAKKIILAIIVMLLLVMVIVSVQGADPTTVPTPPPPPPDSTLTTEKPKVSVQRADPTTVPTPPPPPPDSTLTTKEPIPHEVPPKTTPIGLRSGILQFLSYYKQYTGFATLGSLFFTGEGWDNYREKVNQAFCDTVLLGGTQCWTSRICDTQLYPLLRHSNVFSGRTPSRERQATASIQAEKSLPISSVDKNGKPITLRLYKVTYVINSPYEEQEIKYNVQFRTAEGYKINWFPEYQIAPDYRREDGPLMEYGRNDYNKVCLVFTPSLIDYGASWHGRRIR